MTTKLTAVEGWAQVFKTIIDECDPQALTEADGYVWRYVANQRKEIERLRAENAELHSNQRLQREVLRAMVEILGSKPSDDYEFENRRRDQWHYARLLTGNTGAGWDSEAAGRGEKSFKGQER